jgi:MFS family permease
VTAREGHPNRTLAVLGCATLAFALAQTMLIPSLPAIQAEQGVDASQATWLLTAFLLTASASTPIAGRLGDIFGKELLLVCCLGLFGLGSLVCALGSSMTALIAGRGVQGLGAGIIPLTIGIVRDVIPREKAAVGIGLLSAMFGVGGGLGLVLAGLLVEHASVAWIFWLSVIVTALVAPAAWRLVPRTRRQRSHGSLDWTGSALLAAWLFLLLLAVSEANAWGWLSAPTLLVFAGSALLGAVWAWWERRVAEPAVDLRLMTMRSVWSTNVAAFLVGFAYFGAFVLVPQFVAMPRSSGYGFGASVSASGLYLLPSSVLMLVAGLVSGRLANRFGARLPLLLGATVGTTGYLWMTFLHATPGDVYVGSGLIGLGMGLSVSSIANHAVHAVPRGRTGMAVGINAIMRMSGGALGAQAAAASITGHLGARGLPLESGFTTTFTISAAAGLLTLLIVGLVPSSSGAARRRLQPEAAG